MTIASKITRGITRVITRFPTEAAGRLGPELLTNNDFTAALLPAWVFAGFGGTATRVGDTLRLASGASQIAGVIQSITCTAGLTYRVSMTVSTYSGSGAVRLFVGDDNLLATPAIRLTSATSSGDVDFLCAESGGLTIATDFGVAGQDHNVDICSCKLLS